MAAAAAMVWSPTPMPMPMSADSRICSNLSLLSRSFPSAKKAATEMGHKPPAKGMASTWQQLHGMQGGTLQGSTSRREGGGARYHTDAIVIDANDDLEEQSTRDRLELDSELVTRLNLYLKSARSIVKLQVVDIVGRVNDEGQTQPARVRKGRIPLHAEQRAGIGASSRNKASSGITCCLVERIPFERCEVVATVVKTKVIYTVKREKERSRPWKGKGRATDGAGGDNVDQEEPTHEEVSLIFYDIDDDSGATMTCIVRPQQVYQHEMKIFRRAHTQEAGHDLIADRTSGGGTSGDPLVLDEYDSSDDTTPKSDPRLWVYRYTAPPAVPPAARKGKPDAPAHFVPPIHAEGSLVRIIGNISVNPKNGERQLDAYRIDRIDTADPANRYAEWHHQREARRLMREVYSRRDRVLDLIVGGPALVVESQGSVLNDSDTREDMDHTLTQGGATPSETSSMTGLTSSLLNGTIFNLSQSPTTSVRNTSSGPKRSRAKLPSLKTLADERRPVTRENFLLYLQQHFRRHSVHPSISGRSGAASCERILDDMQPELEPGARTQLKEERRFNVQDLARDRSLDWLLRQCAKQEYKREAELLEPSERARAKGVDASVILPTSSPARPGASRTSSRPGAAGKEDFIIARKAKVLNWAITTLVRDGVLRCHPPELHVEKVRPASSCLCVKDGNAAMSRPTRNDKAACSELSCSASKASQQEDSETYSLISAEAFLPLVEQLTMRNFLDGAGTQSRRPSVDVVLEMLKRQDDMFRYITRETVEEAMGMI